MRQLIHNVTLICLLSAFVLGLNIPVNPCVPARYGDNEAIDDGVVCVKDRIETIERRAPLDIDTIKTRMGNVLDQKKMVNDGLWIFWSGFDRTPAFDAWTDSVRGKMLADTWKDEAQKQEEMAPYVAASETWKFWAYNSKAFAQFVKGDVVVVIPAGQPLNKPYANGKGSNFWTFELPELVRRPRDIGSIRLVQVEMNPDGTPKPKLDDFERSRAIWNAKWDTKWAKPEHYNTPGDPDVPPTQPTGEDWKVPLPA